MSQPAAVRAAPLAAALRAALAVRRDIVLSAPTGAGKSTAVPLMLLEEADTGGGKILLLEPRRMAARAIATRMASLRGEAVGQSIGYRMRLDTRVSRATRIEVLTEGVLTRRLQDDPALDGVAWVLFDEFHERSLNADLALALCLDARTQLAASFRILVMSATLEQERIAQLLGDPALVRLDGRAFEVQRRYLGRGLPLLPGSGAEAAALVRQVMRGIEAALEETHGDVLVFLPGAGEIRRVESELAHSAGAAALVIQPLYGELGAGAQDAVLDGPIPGRRRIVLATNIAETSLTIPGITAVVDGGLVRRSRFDPVTGMSRLELMRISRASAEQRAGRAGRLEPGVCYRLWSEGAQASLAASSTPEILEADLAPLALELARWGARDATHLAWLDPPPEAMLAQARALLGRLEAIDAEGRLTPHGARMAALAVHPRLAHMLLTARHFGAVAIAARLAALLSERDLLRAEPDLALRLALWDGASARDVDRAALERVWRSAQQLEAAVPALARSEWSPALAPLQALPPAALPGALLALAYPDRIGQRRSGGDGRFLLENGRGAAFRAPVALAREPYIVAVALDDDRRDARIDLAAAVSLPTLERLYAGQISSEEPLGWDPGEQAVVARRIRRLGALVLEEQLLAAPRSAASLAALFVGLRQLGLDSLPWDRETRTLQARMEFVRLRIAPGAGGLAGWPASDEAALEATLEEWLAPWLEGVTRRAQLARVALGDALRARLTREQQRSLEALAPRDLLVPSGSRIRIDYLDESAPCVAVRVQEVFGLESTPLIGGVVPLTFKLLSPAQRPVQITRDLAGFWRSSYAAVRRDLRGRYPKFPWPENPLEATATRGPQRRPKPGG